MAWWNDPDECEARVRRLRVARKILALNTRAYAYQRGADKLREKCAQAAARVREMMEIVICRECRNPKPRLEECPNPACWPGLKDYLTAIGQWESRLKAFLNQKQAGHGRYFQPGALRDIYERSVEPRPKREDYEHQT